MKIVLDEITKMSKQELIKLVLDLDLEIHSLETNLAIYSSITQDKILKRFGHIADAQDEYRERTVYMEEFSKAKSVKVKFIKEWLGWYDVVNKIGRIKTVKKIRNKYWECSGHGHPILDIPNDCVIEIEDKKKWWKK